MLEGEIKQYNLYMVLNEFSRLVKFKAADYIYLLILGEARAIHVPSVDLHSEE